MATQTPTIDSQVHAYERNRPERPWSGFLQGADEGTGDDRVTAMDAVGVDGKSLRLTHLSKVMFPDDPVVREGI